MVQQDEQPMALTGLKVLDLSRILAGPYATQLFADLGADVVKVENPDGGDDTRRWGPPFTTKADGGRGDAAYFSACNRNKRSITVDFASRAGADLLRDLAAKADIIVENFRPGGLKKYGLDYVSIAAINPGIIYCSITGFGQTGPYANRPGYDFLIQGMGGLMSVTGEPDGMPMKIGVALVDVLTGTNAATAILAAVMHAQRTGDGQHIDMSLFDVSVASLANQALNYLVSGQVPSRLGNAHPNIVPYQAFATADGHIILAVGNDSQFRKFCEVADCAALADDPAYATNRARVENRDRLLPHITAAFARQTTDWWLGELANVGVPAGPINPIDAVLDEPQARHRGLASSIADEKLGSLPTIASPLRLSETPPQNTLPPPPLGAHSVEVLREFLDMDRAEIDRLMASGVIADNS